MFLLQTESITNLSGYSESPGKKNYFWKRSCLQSFSHFLTEKAFGAECPLIPLAFEDSKITSCSGIIFEVTCISIKCRSKELTLTWEKSSLQEHLLQDPPCSQFIHNLPVQNSPQAYTWWEQTKLSYLTDYLNDLSFFKAEFIIWAIIGKYCPAIFLGWNRGAQLI